MLMGFKYGDNDKLDLVNWPCIPREGELIRIKKTFWQVVSVIYLDSVISDKPDISIALKPFSEPVSKKSKPINEGGANA